MFLFVFWLRNIPFIKYVRNTGNGGGFIQNVYRCGQGERSITPDMYVRTYNISFHAFVLWCLVLFVEIYPYLHSKRVCLPEIFFLLLLLNVIAVAVSQLKAKTFVGTVTITVAVLLESSPLHLHS